MASVQIFLDTSGVHSPHIICGTKKNARTDLSVDEICLRGPIVKFFATE